MDEGLTRSIRRQKYLKMRIAGGGESTYLCPYMLGLLSTIPSPSLTCTERHNRKTMTRHACFRSLSLGALALTLLLGSCQGAQKASTAEDKHHLQGTEWCDSTGIFTLHFNSPEDVELSLNYEGSPMGTLTYDIPCHFAGDTIYIDDYSKTTPFGKITILRSFRGIVRGTSISAGFVTSDAEVAPGSTFPTFTELPLQEVIFNKKS